MKRASLQSWLVGLALLAGLGSALSDCGNASVGASSISCPTVACVSGDKCCAVPSSGGVFSCASACEAPADELHCLRPSDCESSASTCCVTASLSGSGIVTESTCHLETLGSTCTQSTACTSSLTATCGGSEVGRLCASGADCSSSESCCSLTISGTTFSGCVASELAMFGKLTCK